MTTDLFDGCAPSQAVRLCGVQSRRASSAVAEGAQGGCTHEAFEPVGPLGVIDPTNRVLRAGRTWRFPAGHL